MIVPIRKILVGAGRAVTVIAVIGLALWIGLVKKYKAPSPMRCLPTTTTMVIRIADREVVSTRLRDVSYKAELSDMLGGERIWKFAEEIDTIFSDGAVVSPTIRMRDLYIAVLPNGKLAGAFCLNNRMEWHKALRTIDRRANMSIRDTTVEDHGLYLIDYAPGKRPLFAAAGGGCLFASEDPRLLIGFGDDDIIPMHDDVGFSAIERTLSQKSALSVYVNCNAAAFAADDIPIAKAYFSTMQGADWLALDITPMPDVLTTDGFKVAVRQTQETLSARGQATQIGVTHRVPSTVTHFERIGAGDRGLSSDAFTEYLSGKADAHKYRELQSELMRRTNVDVEAMLAQVFSSEIAICNYADGSRFMVIDARRGTMAQATFTQALAAMHNGTPPAQPYVISPGVEVVPKSVATNGLQRRQDAQMVSEISVPVYEAFHKNDYMFFLPFLLGNDYPRRFFFRYEDALVVADDVNTLKRVLVDYIAGHSMESTTGYKQLRRNFSSDCVRFVYEKEPRGGNFGVIGIQTTAVGKLPYISIAALTPQANEEAQDNALWRVRLDTTAATQPFAVDNHYTHKSECLVQDVAGRVYLIGTDGMILWKRAIDGKIVGNVSQVDFYGNGKLQYVFTTRQTLYVIDRLGNDVGSFPVRLPSGATSGVSPALYGDGSPLRFFVGCESGVALFGPDGQRVDGWNMTAPEGQLAGPTKHLVCGSKDFIVSHDQYAYYFNDRQGKKRLQVEPIAPSAESVMATDAMGMSFVTSLADGSIVSINAESGKISRMLLDSIGTNSIGKPMKDKQLYVIADKQRLALIDISGVGVSLLGSYKTDVAHVSQVETIEDKVVIYDGVDHKVYVYNSDGRCDHTMSPLGAHSRVSPGKGSSTMVIFTTDESGAVVCLGANR